MSKTDKLTDESIITWGEHSGKRLCDIPDEWFLRLYDSGKCFGPIKTYIGENLDAIKANIERQNANKYKNRQR